MKNKNNDWKFYAILVVGTAISIIALLTEPMGVIDNSVLLLVGQLTVLCASLFNVSIVLDIKEKYFCLGKNPKSELNEKNEKEADKDDVKSTEQP